MKCFVNLKIDDKVKKMTINDAECAASNILAVGVFKGTEGRSWGLSDWQVKCIANTLSRIPSSDEGVALAFLSKLKLSYSDYQKIANEFDRVFPVKAESLADLVRAWHKFKYFHPTPEDRLEREASNYLIVLKQHSYRILGCLSETEILWMLRKLKLGYSDLQSLAAMWNCSILSDYLECNSACDPMSLEEAYEEFSHLTMEVLYGSCTKELSKEMLGFLGNDLMIERNEGYESDRLKLIANAIYLMLDDLRVKEYLALFNPEPHECCEIAACLTSDEEAKSCLSVADLLQVWKYNHIGMTQVADSFWKGARYGNLER